MNKHLAEVHAVDSQQFQNEIQTLGILYFVSDICVCVCVCVGGGGGGGVAYDPPPVYTQILIKI